jgi:signal peptidase I
MAYGINFDLFGKDILTVKMRDPQRFDIIIFRYPDNEKELYIKRLIGLPGETVEIFEGKVYINGAEVPLPDDFIEEPMYGSFGPYQVPENCYFMLGDNRNNSKDSRFWDNPYVTFDQIVGKALFRYFWPPKLLTDSKKWNDLAKATGAVE